MKKAAIVRIIIASIALVILISILIVGLTGEGFRMFRFKFGGFSNYSYADSDLYNVGDASISTEGINELDINWIEGSVKVITHSGSEISIFESNAGKFNEDEKLRYLVKDGVLYIKYCAPRQLFTFGRLISYVKNLTVYIPEGETVLLRTLTVDTVSADVIINDIYADEIKLNCVSGDIKGDLSGTIEKLTAKTVSGNINIKAASDTVNFTSISGDIIYNGGASDIDCNNVSGNVKVETDICPSRANLKTVSGNIVMSIPENKGFTASYSVVSGDFNTSFATVNSKKQAVYGDGSAEFNLKAVSGNITIKRK